jgi:hypothetical protein
VTVWQWVLIWALLLLATLVVFGMLGLWLYRKAAALVVEMGRAGDRLAVAAERLEEAQAAIPPEPAVFARPGDLRQDLRQDRRRGRRARHRAVSGWFGGVPDATGRLRT